MVLAALVAVGFLVPHAVTFAGQRLAIFEGQKAPQSAASSQAATQQATPSLAEAMKPAAPTDPSLATAPPDTALVPMAQPQSAAEVSQTPAKPEQAPHQPAIHAKTQVAASGTSSGQSGAQQAAPIAAPPAPAGPSPQEIQKAQDRLGDLGARADAARNGVNSIRRQQQAQGLDLRGDILAAESRLGNDMNGANQALNRSDPDSANQYMDRAERELTTLESFLGR